MKILTTDLARESAQSTQRMRVGMIGLAAVLLLIGLAAAIFSTATHERQVAAIGAANADVVANMVDGNSADAATKEPLAELGVAPSASGNDSAAALSNRNMPVAP